MSLLFKGSWLVNSSWQLLLQTLAQFIPSSLTQLSVLSFWSVSAPTCVLQEAGTVPLLGFTFSQPTLLMAAGAGALSQPRLRFLENHWHVHLLPRWRWRPSCVDLRLSTASSLAMDLVPYCIHSSHASLSFSPFLQIVSSLITGDVSSLTAQ